MVKKECKHERTEIEKGCRTECEEGNTKEIEV